MIVEEVCSRKLLVRVALQEGFDVIRKDIVVVCPRKGVLEWNYVNFVELRNLVPSDKNFGVSRQDSQPCRLGGLHLKPDFANLEHLVCVKEFDLLAGPRCEGFVVGLLEVRKQHLLKDVVRGHSLRPPSTELTWSQMMSPAPTAWPLSRRCRSKGDNFSSRSTEDWGGSLKPTVVLRSSPVSSRRPSPVPVPPVLVPPVPVPVLVPVPVPPPSPPPSPTQVL
eukprot:CAMPEP_0206458800 /NCGR_PEP_ID=MMETSP0324_2-20121206/23789_1 /ASSEMBLY_ACC=CAM_ASM_000836 /TAXON_ID=2866 /ORGANISM="Crypthecodinium cohnii, Strain Seligo" /LENGTH=221 /DNA_ID=CAMNT_0053930215 /DNA_START=309 /DNA_END=971 /DNA_ORIENTATION=-